MLTNSTTDRWEAVYYTNPIPLSSRSLLAFALLFDRVHLPGLSFGQQEPVSADERKKQLDEWARRPLPPSRTEALFMRPQQNLALWSIQQPALSDFIHLPDNDRLTAPSREIESEARKIIDDTIGQGTAESVLTIAATEYVLETPTGKPVHSYTWPFYQACALRHATLNALPLISDDMRFVPPLPEHPQAKWDTKMMAQQIAVEAVSLVLPRSGAWSWS